MARLGELYENLKDFRTKELFLLETPWPLLFITIIYYAFIYKIGPDYMKSRAPFKIKRILVYYNAVQMGLNLYIAHGMFSTIYVANWKCIELNQLKTEKEMTTIYFGYIYFLVKILDLFDTVFFVLRKKQVQVSFLHVYHHILMVWIMWFGMIYLPGGHSAHLPFINSIVHSVMYFYYMVAALNGSQNIIWWKKYITQLQLAQFLALQVLFTLPFFMPTCTYPKLIIGIWVPQNMLMIYMFSSFYYKTYIKKKVSP